MAQNGRVLYGRALDCTALLELLFKGEPDGRVLYSRAHVTGQYGTKR